jgi:hypothetical protein
MSRITADEADKRRKFALACWRKNPKLSVPKMNDLIKKEFKGRMNTQHLYAIRKEVWKELGLGDDGEPKKKKGGGDGVAVAREPAAAYSAARSSATKPVGDHEPVVISLRSRDDGPAIAHAFEIARERGLCDVSVELTDKYAILERALAS